MLKPQDSKSEPIQGSKTENKNQNLRILLWDIDRTLLQSTRGGAFKEYFAPAMQEIYGSSGTLAEMSVSGMTDSQIAYEALKTEGFSTEEIFEKINEFTRTLGEKMSRFVVEQNEKSCAFLSSRARKLKRATASSSSRRWKCKTRWNLQKTE